mmetsp:Transcript_22400/g.48741  ORF Transcript_22400/g.48741 Transcript_22400/m.48741 type:complete len:84 (+) Transcript_22400:818-1069(+)
MKLARERIGRHIDSLGNYSWQQLRALELAMFEGPLGEQKQPLPMDVFWITIDIRLGNYRYWTWRQGNSNALLTGGCLFYDFSK